MELTAFLSLQLIAHLLLDFFFQTNRLAEIKNTKGFKSSFLYFHGLFAFLLSWIFSFQVDFVFFAFAIGMIHLLIDGLKNFWTRNDFIRKYIFFIDQAAHLAVIGIVSYLFYSQFGFENAIEINKKFVLILTAFLISLKPANIFIREVFRATEIQVSSDNEMPNAGKVIGILERILTLTLILVSQYSAVGFLIAAKSILRYRSDETLKSEYVLIGTLLSFGIAVISGILVNIL